MRRAVCSGSSVARRSFASVLLLLLLPLAGCARFLPPPRQTISEPARRVLAVLHSRWEALSDMRTLAEMTIERGDVREQFTGILLVKAPSSVRFEALAPFGQPFLFLVIHGGELVVYNAASNEAMVAPATPDSMARLVSLPFEPDDLVGVLVGRPAPLHDLRRADLAEPDQAGPSIYLSGPDHLQRIWLDPDTGTVHQMQIAGGRYEVFVTYDRDENAAITGLRLTAPVARLSATIRYRDPVFGAGVPDERFRFAIPAAAKVEHLR